MSVFSKIRGFLYRHRNKFVVGGLIITSSVLLTRYAQQKLREWQEREAREILERARKQQHFESTERTCNQMMLSLSVTLNESLARTLDTDGIIIELRNKPADKVALWEKLKVLVFARASCLIYLQVMLALTLRIQLNIVGGYLFRDPASVPSDIQERYLTLCRSLLVSGVEKISEVVKEEFQNIIGPIDLKKQFSLKDLDNVFWAIQSTIATSKANPIENFGNYFVPQDVTNGNDVFANMVRDTADLIESDEVKQLASHFINRAFVALNDNISEYYGPTEANKELSQSVQNGTFVHPTNVQIPVAKLIPIINGLISKNTLPEQIIQQLIVNPKLKTLGANIYECFSHVK